MRTRVCLEYFVNGCRLEHFKTLLWYFFVNLFLLENCFLLVLRGCQKQQNLHKLVVHFTFNCKYLVSSAKLHGSFTEILLMITMNIKIKVKSGYGNYFTGSMAILFPANFSSRSQIFFKIGVLKNLWIFTEKHLCRSLFLLRLPYRCFPEKFPNSRTPRWLLLKLIYL